MGSFIDLNTLSAGLIPYTDLRGDGIVFDTTTPSSVTETIIGRIYNIQPTIEVLSLTDPLSAQLEYEIDLTGSTYQTLEFLNAPSTVIITQVGKVYTVTNILGINQWNAVKNPRLTYPTETIGSVPSFTARIRYKTLSGTVTTISWTYSLTLGKIALSMSFNMTKQISKIMNTTVALNAVFSIPEAELDNNIIFADVDTYFFYGPGETVDFEFPPFILTQEIPIVMKVIPSNSSLVSTMSVSGSPSVFSFNSSSKVGTFTGLTSEIQPYLTSLDVTFDAAATEDLTFTIEFTSTGPGWEDTQYFTVDAYTTVVWSSVGVGSYETSATRTIVGNPTLQTLNDKAYVVTVTPSNTSLVDTISSSGYTGYKFDSTFNYTGKFLEEQKQAVQDGIPSYVNDITDVWIGNSTTGEIIRYSMRYFLSNGQVVDGNGDPYEVEIGEIVFTGQVDYVDTMDFQGQDFYGGWNNYIIGNDIDDTVVIAYALTTDTISNYSSPVAMSQYFYHQGNNFFTSKYAIAITNPDKQSFLPLYLSIQNNEISYQNIKDGYNFYAAISDSGSTLEKIRMESRYGLSDPADPYPSNVAHYIVTLWNNGTNLYIKLYYYDDTTFTYNPVSVSYSNPTDFIVSEETNGAIFIMINSDKIYRFSRTGTLSLVAENIPLDVVTHWSDNADQFIGYNNDTPTIKQVYNFNTSTYDISFYQSFIDDGAMSVIRNDSSFAATFNDTTGVANIYTLQSNAGYSFDNSSKTLTLYGNPTQINQMLNNLQITGSATATDEDDFTMVYKLFRGSIETIRNQPFNNEKTITSTSQILTNNFVMSITVD